MEDYDKLVERAQSGEIDDLQFLLSQEGLAEIYVADAQARGITPTPEHARQWMSGHEAALYNDKIWEGVP